MARAGGVWIAAEHDLGTAVRFASRLATGIRSQGLEVGVLCAPRTLTGRDMGAADDSLACLLIPPSQELHEAMGQAREFSRSLDVVVFTGLRFSPSTPRCAWLAVEGEMPLQPDRELGLQQPDIRLSELRTGVAEALGPPLGRFFANERIASGAP